MRENAQVIIDRWPTNYVLYNKIVEYFRDSENADVLYHKGKKIPKDFIRPRGHGCYGPSLHKASELLKNHDDSASALQILLLSDGRPSDSHVLKQKNVDNVLKMAIEKLSSEFGRRFNFAAIGMGNMKDYDSLKAMVDSCKDFGGMSTFQVPGMSCADIGIALSSAATSLTACQTELASKCDAAGQKRQRRVRSCKRENCRLLPVLTEMVDDTFEIYMNDEVERCV